MSGLLLEDIFDVKDVDPEGQKYNRVSRLVCEGKSSKLNLLLEVNSEIYPVKMNEQLSVMLTTSLKKNWMPDSGEYAHSDTSVSLADSFEYVTNGRIYRIDDDDFHNGLAVYASFGGLIMRLRGSAQSLQMFEVDMSIYLLMKKVAS